MKYVLTEEQNKFKEHLFKTGEYLDDYQCLIINASSETGINIIDPKVNLAIINSTNETTVTQARGRVRRDINLLVVRTNETEKVNFKVIIPDEWLNKPLNTDDKKILCSELDLRGTDKHRVNWNKLKLLLSESLYKIEDKRMIIDGKRQRISIITQIKDIDELDTEVQNVLRR